MKNTLKKVLFSLWAITLLWAWSIGLVNAADGGWDGTVWMANQTTDPAFKLWGHDLITQGWDSKLLKNAISFVNRMMSILSVVALVVLLIWWYRMITANWDEGKYKKWLTVLKQAAIWLVVIGLSWAIIRLIFRFIWRWDNNSGTGFDSAI